jgi:hypothetical protein
LCSVFDLAYIGLLLWARRGLALVPADRAAMGTFSTTGVETSRS